MNLCHVHQIFVGAYAARALAEHVSTQASFSSYLSVARGLRWHKRDLFLISGLQPVKKSSDLLVLFRLNINAINHQRPGLDHSIALR